METRLVASTVIMTYATGRVARFVAKRHRRSSRYGWWAVVHGSPDRLGLLNLERMGRRTPPQLGLAGKAECRR